MAQTVAFDLDGTLINIDSAQAWLEFILAQSFPGAAQAHRACEKIMRAYAKGSMDMADYMRAWMTPLVGLPPQQLKPLLQKFVQEVVVPAMYTEGTEQIRYHRLAGDHLLLISASPALIVKPIADYLHIRQSVGIEVAMLDNRLTDRCLEPLSFREGKVSLIKHWLSQLGRERLDIAYSDSINDVAMLQFAHQGVCINPDHRLSAMAAELAWQTYRWHGQTMERQS